MNILGILNFSDGDLLGLVILAIVIIVILFVLKFVLKMAFNVVKMGCFVGVLIIAAVALLLWII
ncbi:MAG: hypothetical protein GWP17_03015 [Aquificales bacterium]|nr:hypothetical protein [Aquificales bacterium]